MPPSSTAALRSVVEACGEGPERRVTFLGVCVAVRPARPRVRRKKNGAADQQVPLKLTARRVPKREAVLHAGGFARAVEWLHCEAETAAHTVAFGVATTARHPRAAGCSSHAAGTGTAVVIPTRGNSKPKRKTRRHN